MNLIVNGKGLDYGGSPALNVFLREQGVETVRVAVMVNDDIVPQRERERVMLRDGDRVEIIIFAGGG